MNTTKRNRWTQEQLEFLQKNYKTEQKEVLLIGTGKKWSTIQKAARKFKLTRKCKINKSKKGWTDDKLNILREIYPIKTKEEILKEFPSHNWHSIEVYASRYGIIRNKDIAFDRGRKGDLNCLLNDNHESYYWIGFIFADGYIHHKSNHLIIFLDKKDEIHLQKYANYVNGKIKYYTYEKHFRVDGCKYTSKMCRVAIAQKNVVPKIISKFGFKPTKTYNPPDTKILESILDTKEKLLSFLCGFIDGDGYIQPGSIKIENHASWTHIHELFKKLLIKFLNFKEEDFIININKRGYSSMWLNNKTNLSIIKKEMQSMKIPYMERKWSQINEFDKNKNDKYLDKIETIKREIKNELTVPQIAVKLNITENSVRSEIYKHKLNYNRIYKK